MSNLFFGMAIGALIALAGLWIGTQQVDKAGSDVPRWGQE